MDLLQLIAPYAEIGLERISIFAGVFTRISAFVFFLPGLSEQTVSMRVRLAAALAIALVLTPIVLDAAPHAPQSAIEATLAFAAEALAGAVIGFSIRVAIFAIQIAGSIAAQSLSLSQLFGTSLNSQPEPPIGTLFMFAGIAVAVSAGLHFKAVSALALSYEIMPFGVFPGASETGEWAAARTAFAFSAGLTLAMPFVVLGFVYYLAIGAANRAMPQLMVAFVGAPAITLGGLALLALATPVMLSGWLNMVDAIIAQLAGVAL
ncbi:MAG: flagellar biosynthetic protein FliR [Parvularculaceae bacterium]